MIFSSSSTLIYCKFLSDFRFYLLPTFRLLKSLVSLWPPLQLWTIVTKEISTCGQKKSVLLRQHTDAWVYAPISPDQTLTLITNIFHIYHKCIPNILQVCQKIFIYLHKYSSFFLYRLLSTCSNQPWSDASYSEGSIFILKTKINSKSKFVSLQIVEADQKQKIVLYPVDEIWHILSVMSFKMARWV